MGVMWSDGSGVRSFTPELLPHALPKKAVCFEAQSRHSRVSALHMTPRRKMVSTSMWLIVNRFQTDP